MFQFFLGSLLFTLVSLVHLQSSFTTKVLHVYNPINNRVEHKALPTPKYENYQFHNGLERVKRFYPQDIKGKTILDMGCNNGDLLFALKRKGAGPIRGVDLVESLIQEASATAAKLHIKDSQFMVGDMETKGLYLNLEPADTVFFMRILDTSQFENRTAVITNVARLAKEVLYYEGHCFETSHVPRLYQLMTWTDFTRFEYLGKSKDGRPLIRCSREIITSDQVPDHAVTSDDPDHLQQAASEIYVYKTSPFNPVFSEKCKLIQYVKKS